MVMTGVNKDQDGEPTNDMRVVDFHKNNYGPITAQIVLRWHNGVFVPVAGATVDQAERDQRAEEVYMDILQTLTIQNQDLATGKNAENYAPKMISDHPRCKTFSEPDMEKAQRRLLDANKIHIVTEGPPSRQRKRIKPGPRPSGMQEPM
jgi:hypothetical protein